MVCPPQSDVCRCVFNAPVEVLIHILSFLEPSSLLSASLISKRFYAAVNSPDAWRAAFVRSFPLPHTQLDDRSPATLASHDKRYFTRLPATEFDANPWRKEYTQRTQLLRSLCKGKAQGSGLSNRANSGYLVVTYHFLTGPLSVSVSHMVVEFSKAGVRAVHASRETQAMTESDATKGLCAHATPIFDTD